MEMINDFSEIKNEKDREIYVQIRQIIDQFFLDTIEHHKSSDHKYHECFKNEYETQKKEFLEALKKQKTTKSVTSLIWVNNNVDKMMNHIRALMILKEYIKNENINLAEVFIDKRDYYK